MNTDDQNWIDPTQLPDPEPGPLATEYRCYRRELKRWLAEGQEGKWVVIKGEEIIGLFATKNEALSAGYERFLLQGFLVQQIQPRERIFRLLWGYFQCPK